MYRVCIFHDRKILYEKKTEVRGFRLSVKLLFFGDLLLQLLDDGILSGDFSILLGDHFYFLPRGCFEKSGPIVDFPGFVFLGCQVDF